MSKSDEFKLGGGVPSVQQFLFSQNLTKISADG